MVIKKLISMDAKGMNIMYYALSRSEFKETHLATIPGTYVML